MGSSISGRLFTYFLGHALTVMPPEDKTMQNFCRYIDDGNTISKNVCRRSRIDTPALNIALIVSGRGEVSTNQPGRPLVLNISKLIMPPVYSQKKKTLKTENRTLRH